ncbi:O-antigen ligase family protein [Aurantiacibacter zhengii]|nr:O-antigen ligase family protein [Aurantiacibacter zhengii]
MRLTKIVDYALWALVMLTLARTTVLVRQRDTSDFDTVDFSATFAIVVIASILVALVLHPRGRNTLMQLRESSALILLIFLIYGAASAMWSDFSTFVLFRAGEVLAVMGALFVLMEGYKNWQNAERAMLVVLMVATLMGVAQRVILAGISVEGLHTNIYTVTAGMGFLYALGESLRADPQRRRRLRRWAAAFAFFVVIGTSAGSNIAVAAGMLILLPFLSRSKLVIIPAALACMAVIVIMGTSEDVVSVTLLSGRSLEDVQTMTGRTNLWTAYWNAFLEKPILGHGFAIVARLGDQFGTVATTNAHNGFIDALAGLGVLGFLTMLIYSIKLVTEALRASRAQIAGGLGCLAAFVMMLVNNNSKSILGGSYDPVVVGVFAMLAFFHIFTLRAMQAQERDNRNAPPAVPEPAGGATAAHP